ncbi:MULTISPECIES: ImmA/IrrE family metallo-endopeptidase [Rhodopirellula]|uniref:ImmA/IrrE family metallo-endopeptidase n=1 Tax=Rhodopirellula TaxID=265488 RepID=UPI00257A329D|nr:ImmA/IrrE family metallo-endopeptidase [Rhodopirellula sp. UBA1907]
MANFISIEPNMLTWAVQRARKDASDFKQPVREWIDGGRKPTLKQLQDFARAAMVPLGYLFLETPPEEKLPVPDFRTRLSKEVESPSPNLIDTIFEMERRQDWMRDYLIDAGQDPLEFVGKFSVDSDVVEVANDIRRELGLPLDWAELCSNSSETVRAFRNAVNNAGILIFFNGIVGNTTHRVLDTDEFQGFVLVDNYAPLIFVNSTDAKAAQLFTIAHELAHVWIGQSALFNDLMTDESSQGIERFCNKVAAEFLMPRDVFTATWRLLPAGGRQSELQRKFKTSPIAIAIRAVEHGLMSRKKYEEFLEKYTERLDDADVPEPTSGNFWNNQNSRLCRRFGQAVVAANQEGRLGHMEAYELTNLRGKTFDKYAKRILDGAGE